jgi:hypothetical protein
MTLASGFWAMVGTTMASLHTSCPPNEQPADWAAELGGLHTVGLIGWGRRRGTLRWRRL